MKKTVLICFFSFNILASDLYYIENGKKVILEDYNRYMPLDEQVDYYKDERGILVGVTNKIIIKLQNSDCIDEILKKYDLLLLQKPSNNVYLLEAKNKDLTLKIANSLNINECVVFSHPDFLKQRLTR